MERIIKLTEANLNRIVKRVISEQNPPTVSAKQPVAPTNSPTPKPKQCDQNKVGYVKNYLNGQAYGTKIKLENNVSAGISGKIAGGIVFVTLGNEPTCWCNAGDLIN